MTVPPVTVVRVFGDGPGGGNPAPIVLQADGWSDDAMQQVAIDYELESGFVSSPPDGSEADFEFRFWVPRHEMEMCGHATVGAAWLLQRSGRWTRDSATIVTQSGLVQVRASAPFIEISQPAATIEPVANLVPVLEVLGLKPTDLADWPIVNAATSRVKTLVPVRNVDVLDALSPGYEAIGDVCRQIGSTGLYPYAVDDAEARTLAARQFPRSSGYPEDAATGIAAAALACTAGSTGLFDPSEGPIRVRQGFAMGRPSLITIELELQEGKISGCWLGGGVELDERLSPGPRPAL